MRIGTKNIDKIKITILLRLFRLAQISDLFLFQNIIIKYRNTLCKIPIIF